MGKINYWERGRRESKNKSNIYEIFFVQVCKRRCNRNNFDDAIFLFACSHASHVFQNCDSESVCRTSGYCCSFKCLFSFGFFLDESFNKKRSFKQSMVFRAFLQIPCPGTRGRCCTHNEARALQCGGKSWHFLWHFVYICVVIFQVTSWILQQLLWQQQDFGNHCSSCIT